MYICEMEIITDAIPSVEVNLVLKAVFIGKDRYRTDRGNNPLLASHFLILLRFQNRCLLLRHIVR
jgi:hypothetical protein